MMLVGIINYCFPNNVQNEAEFLGFMFTSIGSGPKSYQYKAGSWTPFQFVA